MAAALAGLLASGSAIPSVASPDVRSGPQHYYHLNSHPVVDPDYPAVGTTTVDALHYLLHLDWDDEKRMLSGRAKIIFRAPTHESSFSLDLEHRLHVSSVLVDGVAADYEHHGAMLSVAPAALGRGVHGVRVTYKGKPGPVAAPTTRSDIPHLGWTDQPDGSAWSLQEPYGAYTWYPVNDHPSDKASYDITWVTRKAWRGISNGRLLSDDVVDGRRVMHWQQYLPMASYLVAAAVGPYHSVTQRGPHGLHLTYWLRGHDGRSLAVLRRSPSLIAWLEHRLGRYPFGRWLSDVVEPTHSAEETQTMVTMGRSVLHSPEGLPDLLHEYSHQWYGDEVTPRDWTDLWMNESFAMYIQFRWMVDHNYASMAFFRRQMDKYDQRYRHHYGPPGRYDRTEFGAINVYYCGARMLDRMHSKLGNREMWRLLRKWPRTHRYANADRSDWIRYVNHQTGRNFTHFIHHWLMAKHSPK
jgi:aminopeptidase N